jgi:hypothetical protein
LAELPDTWRTKLSEALGLVVTLHGEPMLVDTDVLIRHR